MLAEAPIDEIALLRVDGRDPDRIRTALDALYERVASGGFVVVDHSGAADRIAALESFRAEHGIREQLEQVDWGAAGWRRATDPRSERSSTESTPLVGPPRMRAAPATTDLSVVVVVHNMLREARRTLHSLSRAYQQGIEDLDYEVIVVENGSAPDQLLGEELVRSHGAEFRYIDLGDDAAPSPAHAVNRGIAESTGAAVAVMIDGAHLLTPGVLRFGMLGLSTYSPAVVTARQWYLGPGQQPEAVEAGYDREYEDRLLEQIGWPADGYQMFELGHFIGERDWFDGEWESNCIFVPRVLIDELGGMDESFSTPGGGFVNLDFFERMVTAPGVTQVTILGEASFHQVHGGTTTNLADSEQRWDRIRSYDAQYAELRGRPFKIPPQDVHYVGRLPPSARRTRSRRMSSPRHFKGGQPLMADGRPARSVPVPQDLRFEFIDAFWRSGEWHHARWLGRPTHRAVTDLFAYQELIFRLRPEWIVETRTGPGGRAMFLASICDLVGTGHVISIDGNPIGEPPEHPRVTFLRGAPEAESTVAEVRGLLGERPRGLLILGAADEPQVTAAFRNYSTFVPPGSYVVIEDTILGGSPVWPGFGPGPASAAQKIVDDGDFVPDRSLERSGLTFNVAGFLKRVR